jgi:hypothetical protein
VFTLSERLMLGTMVLGIFLQILDISTGSRSWVPFALLVVWIAIGVAIVLKARTRRRG